MRTLLRARLRSFSLKSLLRQPRCTCLVGASDIVVSLNAQSISRVAPSPW